MKYLKKIEKLINLKIKFIVNFSSIFLDIILNKKLRISKDYKKMGKKILFSILALTTLIFLFVNRAKPSFEAQKQKTKEDFNCLREWEIRNQIVKSLSSGKKIIVGPKLIRMLFHDSIDRNNLIDKHGSRATYENGTTILGGVDFCLYTGLQDMPSNGSDTVDILADNPDGNPNHNRGNFFLI